MLKGSVGRVFRPGVLEWPGIYDAKRGPRIGVRSQEQRDRRRAYHLRRSRRHTRPTDLPGEAQHVEPGAIEVLDARRKDVALPRGCRQLETIELRDHRAQPLDATQAASPVDVLPREQESHVLGRTDRRDLRAQTVERVAM